MSFLHHRNQDDKNDFTNALIRKLRILKSSRFSFFFMDERGKWKAFLVSTIARETQLKGWRRSKKIALIEKMNPRWQDLAEHWGEKMLFQGEIMEETP